ncbi:class I SAM-dependent methyltransferase [Minwuia sp. IMCC3077]|uniref:class I SAM-dependent methyltransferase n=1 Tax=Minwuia sp. IMCC3077 TaxID=3040676 RepID=UPI00247868BF|nr:class I SAM-dependent methyltransferase [Minwuia sp. IMCC3077]
MPAAYDTIGINYANLRQPDPRIGAAIGAALGDAATVLNVGAGTGSYEPTHRTVTALEPSIAMIRQRPAGAAPVIRGFAEDLPFADKAFDAVMAVLTVHHWSDQPKGLAELRRVSRGPTVILTFDPTHRGFWLTDYLPELITIDVAQMPPMSAYAAALGPVRITPVPIPHDCADGFLAAYWRRPTAYLDPRIRAAISCFWAIESLEAKLERLARDLETGAWGEKYGHLLELESCDLGYRLVVGRG